MFLLYLSLEYIEHNLCGAHKEHSLRAFLYQASGNANLTKVNNKSPYQYWGIKIASKFSCKQLKEKCDCAIWAKNLIALTQMVKKNICLYVSAKTHENRDHSWAL